MSMSWDIHPEMNQSPLWVAELKRWRELKCPQCNTHLEALTELSGENHLLILYTAHFYMVIQIQILHQMSLFAWDGCFSGTNGVMDLRIYQSSRCKQIITIIRSSIIFSNSEGSKRVSTWSRNAPFFQLEADGLTGRNPFKHFSFLGC